MFSLQLLKELDLNVDVDVAFLAAQTPPIKIFPSSNTSHLPYDEQMAILETDYIKYYEYRGDMKYHEKMKRSISVSKATGRSADATISYRVCRDKKSFFEARIKDDVIILGKILESMIERTSEMEKHLENILREGGEKELPNWDKLYEDTAQNTTPKLKNDDKVKVVPKTSKNTKRSATTQKPKVKKIAEIKQNLIAAPNQLNGDQNQPTMTHEQNQMLVARMMLARSLAHSNRIHSNGEHSYANVVNRPGNTFDK